MGRRPTIRHRGVRRRLIHHDTHRPVRLSLLQGPPPARRPLHRRRRRQAGHGHRGVRHAPQTLPLLLPPPPRDPDGPHHGRTHLRAEDGVLAPRLPVRRTRRRPAHPRRRDARAAPRIGGGPPPRPGRLLRRDPRVPHHRGAARRRVRRRPPGPGRGHREVHGRHQPADRRPVAPRAPLRPPRAGRHDRLRHPGDGLPPLRRPGTGRLPRLRRRHRRHRPHVRRPATPPPALQIRPHPAPRRALAGPVQPGRQRGGVPLRRDPAGAGQGPHDALQTPPRGGRARDDGQHPARDEGQALGILPRDDTPALG